MAVVTAATTATADTTTVATDLPAGRYVDWGPIVLGTLGALAIMVVLMTFGGALGLSVTSPQPYAGLSAKALAVLAGLYIALVHVASFATGGYLAGRMRTPWVTSDTVERHFRDGGHGFAVWALGVVVGAALALSGAGGIAKAVTGATTAVAAAGTAGAAANPQTPQALQQLSAQPADYAVDRLLAPGPTGAPPAAGAVAGSRADLAAPIARAFTANLDNPQLDARDRAWLASLVGQRTGLPQAEAEKRVDEAFTELKAAEQKARDAADKARRATLIAGFLAAATMAIGAAAACAGAALGARHRDERTLVVLFGSRRFW
ncbi:MAG: hypothetical protein HYX38_33630 [Rhodospirillales bacterium]|nr:hypothetical protein [Rhodospirillales bacterium]